MTVTGGYLVSGSGIDRQEVRKNEYLSWDWLSPIGSVYHRSGIYHTRFQDRQTQY
jgi:hypothetical protein